MVRKTLLTLAVAVLCAAPAATATWSAYGSHEPDNGYDSATFNFQEPPGPSDLKVYFNAYTTVYDLANPNVGALETTLETPAAEFHEAILGVWRDCNGDGYIGLAETAMREYPAALLGDASACPPVGGTATAKWPRWAFNYRGWVSELIPIAGFTNHTSKSRDTRTLDDTQAMVWGDYGVYNEDPSHRSCTLAPVPRGTLTSTGGVLNYADCRTEALDQWNVVMDGLGDPAGLRFSDADDATVGGHPLDVSTFGSEDTEYSAVHAWDCDADPVVRGRDIDSNVPAFVVYSPNTNPVDGGSPTSWTVPATWNETAEGVQLSDSTANDCDTSNDRGHEFYGNSKFDTGLPFYVGEEDFVGINPKNKLQAEWNLQYGVANRGGAPMSLLVAGPIGGGGSGGVPEGDAGIGITPGGSRWTSDSVWIKPGPSVVRTNVEDPLPTAYFLTFYAHVGANTTAALGAAGIPPGRGAYHAEQCQGATSGIHHGVNCDRDLWYINPDGTRFPEGEVADTFYPTLARPGDPYEFRDVDCYDGQVKEPTTGTTVGTGVPSYGSRPCP